ncbi:MazG family protein [Streptacidiphilus sp. P02-A3a]|uniref:MazG family protein n=1 Tax=Streptacidiphilus sp. P02-A3a TaxID=2704468 RepID=UPI0015F88235|nr:MazG family protein [Streptacidiphilus sp. P02-A3a]QMU67610.1 MazG family protein [Streptacidiphilus sp. P02-A3a]
MADNDLSPNAPAPDAGRLVLLASTHRVAAGLLSWPAWEALRGASRVLVGNEGHPLLAPVRAAGVPVEVVDIERYALGSTLAEAAAPGTVVVWISGPDGDPGLADSLARIAVEGGLDPMPEIELLPGSWDLPGARLLDLVAVMDRLRSPGGCPWDAEQTHESLVRHLVEESYELVEAIEEGDREALLEELGDVLFQVFFHARIAEEDPAEPFGIDDIAGGLIDKLTYRHPHVFGDVHAPTAEQVEANWEQLKAVEKQRESVVDGVPVAQPALALAAKLHSRAVRAELDVPLPEADDLGARLLALAVEAQQQGLDPEAELRAAARRYREAIRQAEKQN